MDPVREMIHLGLKVTEATLDRTLDVVRLVDTLLVASAVPTERGATSQEPVWPEEEQADLDALSATLRARKEPTSEATTTTAQDTAKQAPAKKTTRRKAPAKKTATSPARKARKPSAQQTAATTPPAKKAPTTRSPAKKSTAKKSTAKKSATSGRTPDA
ncbi:hypothetical protein O9K63_05690 [Janibacter cremeus]|uniref:hypothetical protein n=1 Tax=Janibacter cremeus TaxID=1285192 RepID=UPI0023F69504|nr:hypothetical protein [Janibacter cremeus]WEV79288.1 hypothetical protein O9K63_05690 [Janibacter cremeus]